MIGIRAIAFLTGAALFATGASAAIINVAAVDTATGGAPTPTTLILDAGTYTATVVGIAGGGLYDAWNKSSSNGMFYPTGTPAPTPGRWTESYNISIGGGAATNVNGAPEYATAADALAAVAGSPFQFTVASPNTSVSFQITDLPGLYLDNTGGVSLDVAAVPEPATWAVMILGFGAVGVAMRRREKVLAKVSYAA